MEQETTARIKSNHRELERSEEGISKLPELRRERRWSLKEARMVVLITSQGRVGPCRMIWGAALGDASA